jgi:two-component system chemotaxis response regulator CheY
MRALVVDDSRAMRMMLRRTLGDLGFEVLEAEHGAAALAVLDRSGPVEVCLVDWNMPVMDGLEFIRAVRGEPAYERMVLVMVTSESDPARILRALMAGADEYATKPVTPEALADKLGLAGVAEPGGA